MSSYVLYLPGKQGANSQHLADAGLADLLSDRAPEFSDYIDNAPDGGRGLLVAWRIGDSSRDPGFAPNAFDWRPAKADAERGLAAGRFWFGTVKGGKPAPCDIARREGIAGAPIELADGQVWRIPSAEHLPHKHGLDDDGNYCRQVEERYRDYWKASERYAVEFFRAIDQLDLLKQARKVAPEAEDSVSFTLADAWGYCCQSLAINYRVTPAIVDLLGLVDDVAMRNIIKASIDLIAILETRDQKKTAELSIAVG